MSKRRNLKKEKQERNRAYARKFKKRKLRNDGRGEGAGNGVTGTGLDCGISTIVSNAAGSGKVLKINTLQVTAIGATTNVDVKYFDAAAGLGNSVGLALSMTVPLYSSLSLIDKSNSIYLEENRSLGAQRQVNAGTLNIVCSYEQIS